MRRSRRNTYEEEQEEYIQRGTQGIQTRRSSIYIQGRTGEIHLTHKSKSRGNTYKEEQEEYI